MKRMYAILTGLSLLMTVSLYAGDSIASYSCDFEYEPQNAHWKFPVNSDVPHHWTIGTAINNGGRHALYVTPNGLDTPSYVNQTAIVFAYTDITLRRSSERYILSFDWMGAGYTASRMDGLYVFWVPDRDDFGDSIYIADQANASFSPQLYNYVVALNPTMDPPDSLCGKSTWQAWISEKTSHVDNRVPGGRHRRLVFAWRNGTGGPVNPGACIDNINIVDGRACAAPKKLHVTTLGEDSLVLDWEGDIQGYEVGCYSYEKNTWQVVRVDTTHYVYTDVPEGFTDFYVRTICYDTLAQNEYFSAKSQYSDFIYYPGNHCIDYITLSDENCYISTVKTNFVTDDYQYVKQMVDNGEEDKESRHTHHYSKYEMDVRTGGRLRTVPKGEIASTRLGNWKNGGESERAEFKFHVDAEQNPILVMKYAVVLESPGHDKGKLPGAKNLQDPRFTLDVLHKGKSIGACASADYTSSWVSTGWNDTIVVFDDNGSSKRVNVVWKDWTTVGVNLEEYDGEDLIIQLTTYDCSMTAHFGYAYFTLGCAKKQLAGMNCDGKPATDFYAPEGFNYRWYLKNDPNKTVLASTQHFTIDSLDSRDYCVDVLFPENEDCFFTLDASSKPHYPVADFTYKHTPKDCRNYMTITNTSHAETVYKQEQDTLYSQVEMVEWDFGSITGSHIPAGGSAQIEFPAEGGTFPITITAWENNCSQTSVINVIVPPIGEVFTDTTVYRCPGYSYTFEGRNADGTYVRNKEPYTDFGIYLDTLVSSIGCDSIIRTNLDVLEPRIIGQEVVILNDDTLHFHGRDLTQTGVYYDTLRSVHGCDSIIDTVSLYVHEYVQVQMVKRDSLCSELNEWNVPFRIIQGRSCYAYSLVWAEANASLSGIDHEPLPEDNTLRVQIPDGVKPDYYHALFTFHDSLCYISPEVIKDASVTVTFALLYPTAVIAQRWNDVLAIRNEEYNGGFRFDSVQWYINGQPIEGATDFNYYTGSDQKLRFGEEYRALLWRNDGVALFTCPVFPEKVPAEVMEMPSLVNTGAPLAVKGKGTACWFDMLGRPYSTQTYDMSEITAPASQGYYLLVLQSGETRTVHSILVR